MDAHRPYHHWLTVTNSEDGIMQGWKLKVETWRALAQRRQRLKAGAGIWAALSSRDGKSWPTQTKTFVLTKVFH